MAHQPAEKLFHLLGLNIGGDFGPFTFYKTRRGKVVWFLKAPPTCPPSPKQIANRNQFRLAALLWNSLTDAKREQWELTTRRLSLSMTGYNLFLHFTINADAAALATLERQANTQLT